MTKNRAIQNLPKRPLIERQLNSLSINRRSSGMVSAVEHNQRVQLIADLGVAATNFEGVIQYIVGAARAGRGELLKEALQTQRAKLKAACDRTAAMLVDAPDIQAYTRNVGDEFSDAVDAVLNGADNGDLLRAMLQNHGWQDGDLSSLREGMKGGRDTDPALDDLYARIVPLVELHGKHWATITREIHRQLVSESADNPLRRMWTAEKWTPVQERVFSEQVRKTYANRQKTHAE